MATPTKSPNWADGGSGVVTDPGTSKQALGFENAEAPAAGHHNWLLQGHGEWVNFLRDSAALESMMATINFTGSSTELGGFGSNAYYLPGFDTWYSIVDNSGNVDLFDSGDGETWSSVNNETWSMVAPGNVTEDSGKIYFAAGSSGIWSSSTGLVANVAAETNTFANLTSITRVIWDDVNSVFIATGTGGGNADIETSATMNGTWTQRISKTGSMLGLAHNPQLGYSVAFENGALEYVYSTDGTTWSTDTSPTVSAYNVYYNAAVGKFVFHLSGGGAQRLGFTTDGTDYFELDFGGGSPFAGVVNTPAGILAVEQHGSAIEKAYLITGRPHPTDDEQLNIQSVEFNVSTSGHFMTGFPSVGYSVWDYTAGSDAVTHKRALWTYDSVPYWAIADY